MNKFTHVEASNYWRSIHGHTESDLKAVCFPDRSHVFNRFFDRIQKFAVRRCLESLGVSLRDKTLLDLGCGRGRWLEFYAAQGAKVTGIDISNDAIEMCRKKDFNVYQGNIDELRFADDSFDFVNSVTVIQHVVPEDQGKAIEEVQRVLKPGGYAILLENTSNDRSSHVWGMALSKWISLHTESRLIFAENHYFVPLFRFVWAFPGVNGRKALRNSVELVMLPASYVSEYLLMKARFGKHGGFGLQHLMIFQKLAEKEVTNFSNSLE
jgi:ubiquinone/menaquinone biosynthesis C-methylase UbiE